VVDTDAELARLPVEARRLLAQQAV